MEHPQLSSSDAVDVQMQKMVTATNEVVRLTQELITIGTELNQWRGKFAEVKAKIKAQKEIINSLKIVIKAENQYGS